MGLIPEIGHRKLNLVASRPGAKLRSSQLRAELDRIHHRSRPHLAHVPTEDFLNSRPLVWFDDETKYIRAESQALLRRIHSPIPRLSRPLVYSSGGLPYELPYGDISNLKRLESPHSAVLQDILSRSYYNEPSKVSIGRGHLACVSFAGGRGYPRRQHMHHYSDENRDIRDEIMFRSYYDKNRMPAKERDAASYLPTGPEEKAP